MFLLSVRGSSLKGGRKVSRKSLKKFASHRSRYSLILPKGAQLGVALSLAWWSANVELFIKPQLQEHEKSYHTKNIVYHDLMKRRINKALTKWSKIHNFERFNWLNKKLGIEIKTSGEVSPSNISNKSKKILTTTIYWQRGINHSSYVIQWELWYL